MTDHNEHAPDDFQCWLATYSNHTGFTVGDMAAAWYAGWRNKSVSDVLDKSAIATKNEIAKAGREYYNPNHQCEINAAPPVPTATAFSAPSQQGIRQGEQVGAAPDSRISNIRFPAKDAVIRFPAKDAVILGAVDFHKDGTITPVAAAPTPRTDANEFDHRYKDTARKMVYASFAHRLETELAAAKAQLALQRETAANTINREREIAEKAEAALAAAHDKLASLADTIASARRNVNPFDDPHLDYLGDMREDVWKLSYAANDAKSALADLRQENNQLRKHIELRANGQDPLTVSLREQLAAKLAEFESDSPRRSG